MGCSNSKLGEDEAVQICKDRKRFIKQAVEHRTSYASAHIAYIQSLRKVSDALREYIEGDEPHEFPLDTFVTPVKRMSSIELSQSKVESKMEVNYLMASGTRPVQVEVTPPRSPETYHVESYGADSFLGMNMRSPAHNNSPNIPPPSPQNSQWDFFWNPFSSLDYYGYNYDNRSGMEEEVRRVREEEGIPDLEEEDDDDEESPRFQDHHNMKASEMNQEDNVSEVENERDMDFTVTQERESNEVSRGGTTGHHHVVTTDDAKGEETTQHGFTVYLTRRPTSMGEVIKDLEDQFEIICNAANEVSGLLEASRSHYISSNSELSGMKMLNPLALFSSRSSSSSSRFLISSSSKESGFESSSDFSEESSCMLSGSHQSTLDRLYAWEKKLYDEVKSGERVRIAYEKKCLALRNHDVKGDNSSAVDKTRATMRDLHTQMNVSIHSIESISERIETLRDQELLPQLLELLQGLARMWKVMAECHQIQKRTLDEAKLLLAATTMLKKRQHSSLPEINTQRLARSALNLVAQLRNWRVCFQAWITSQRSYVLSLTGWLLRCFRCDPDPEKVRLSTCPHRIYEVCIGWSRLLNGLNEKHVVDKLDFFACGMGSIFARQLREEDQSPRRDGSGSLELVEADKVEEEEEKMMNAEKLSEIAVKVLCHGMSVAVSSLAEFAISSADEHSKLVNRPEETISREAVSGANVNIS
ncbi:unnamed protein product [Eruca vesicaria subsp. sativa]|uniref:Uncharacterized protein n=1 Tax=Eruca vesicaria subsp. sativa TaxID=29727 RepID=A0ABC8JIY4_ERUVS|nr:unnamed protein product [Eruca vesicaria subsp. sativa]